MLYFKKEQKIDLVKVNKVAEEKGEQMDIYFYVVTHGREFQIYINKLDPYLKGEIGEIGDNDTIKCIEFGMDTRSIYFGTERGLIYKYDLISQQMMAEKQKKMQEQAKRKGKNKNNDKNDD